MSSGGPAPLPGGDDAFDARQLAGALKRHAWLVAAAAATLALGALVISLALPSRYQATATIIREEVPSALGAADAETSVRALETIERLLTTNRVLARAAQQLPGDSVGVLAESVEATMDETANVIEVRATAGEPARAAQRANRVSTALLAERQRLELARLERARQALEAQIARLRASGGGEADATIRAQVQGIQQSLSQLGVQAASAGADLQLAQAAQSPDAPASPRPLRNAVLGLFAGLFLGILLALGREQLSPRPKDSRELGRLLDLPVLVEVPFLGGRRRRRALLFAAENEAYQGLRTAVELTLPSDEQHVIVVTSGLHGEGKTTVTARLGTALAQAGHKTLLVTGDLRRPELHTRFGLKQGPGFAEVLAELQAGRRDAAAAALREGLHEVRLPARRRLLAPLDVLLSGETGGGDAGTLLSMESMRAFLRLVRRLDHRYVLIDAPPLLGLSDTQVMAQVAENLIAVSRLDRLSVDRAVDLREALGRVESRGLGLVVIGGRTETSPYYLPTAGSREDAVFAE